MGLEMGPDYDLPKHSQSEKREIDVIKYQA